MEPTPGAGRWTNLERLDAGALWDVKTVRSEGLELDAYNVWLSALDVDSFIWRAADCLDEWNLEEAPSPHEARVHVPKEWPAIWRPCQSPWA